MKTLSQVLSDAADYMEKYGKETGWYGEPIHVEAPGPVCAVGACAVVATEHGDRGCFIADQSDEGMGNRCRVAISKAVGLEIKPRTSLCGDRWDVAWWSDTNDKETVVAGLRLAAELNQ